MKKPNKRLIGAIVSGASATMCTIYTLKKAPKIKEDMEQMAGTEMTKKQKFGRIAKDLGPIIALWALNIGGTAYCYTEGEREIASLGTVIAGTAALLKQSQETIKNLEQEIDPEAVKAAKDKAMQKIVDEHDTKAMEPDERNKKSIYGWEGNTLFYDAIIDKEFYYDAWKCSKILDKFIRDVTTCSERGHICTYGMLYGPDYLNIEGFCPPLLGNVIGFDPNDIYIGSPTPSVSFYPGNVNDQLEAATAFRFDGLEPKFIRDYADENLGVTELNHHSYY